MNNQAQTQRQEVIPTQVHKVTAKHKEVAHTKLQQKAKLQQKQNMTDNPVCKSRR